jgi:hypothetical protein
MAKSILDAYLLAEKQPRIIRSRAMRLKCLDCMGNQQGEVPLCSSYSCPIWPYRMGGRFQKMPESEWLEMRRTFQDSLPCQGKPVGKPASDLDAQEASTGR